MSEIYQYIKEKMGEVDTLNFELRRVGQEAIKEALTKLIELASGGQRPSETCEISFGEEGPEKKIEKLVSDDLEAAKALAKFGVDALKLARSGRAPRDSDSGQTDLFDGDINGPWQLKKIE